MAWELLFILGHKNILKKKGLQLNKSFAEKSGRPNIKNRSATF
jgi:hypothetical protein